MFGSQILEVAIGIVFFYVLLSLLSSALSEVVSSYLNLRSKNLEVAIKRLLNERNAEKKVVDGSLVDNLINHPLINNLTRPKTWLDHVVGEEKVPSYIPSRIFALALLDSIAPAKKYSNPISAGKIRNELIARDNQGLSQSLLPLIDNAVDDMERVISNIENWFDESMDSASGWYKRKAQMFILIFASIITIGLNADTLVIAKSLWTDTALRTALVAQAEHMATQAEALEDKNYKEIYQQLGKLSLPIGWESEPGQPNSFPVTLKDWADKFLGLLMTIIAVSLGAPFWFDMLNKLVNLRSVGKQPLRPEEKKNPKET